MTLSKLIAAVALLVGANFANATNVLIAKGNGDLGYGYSYSNWTTFTNDINNAVAATGGSVTTTTDFGNLAQLLSYDAIMLDQRWTGGSLSATEISNIQAYIATGRHALLIGENNSWTTWNNQLASIVGGSYNGGSAYTGGASAVAANSLTAGVPSVNLLAAGTMSGGTALFSQNFATLWGAQQNALTVLDVNIFDNNNINAQFALNVANWLAAPVPEPETFAMFGLGLLACFVAKRKKA